MPTVLTVYVLYRIFMWVDGILAPITARYPYLDIPGLGFLGVIAIILLAGIVGGGFFGRTLFRWFEGGLEKIPMVRSIYVAIKQVERGLPQAGADRLQEGRARAISASRDIRDRFRDVDMALQGRGRSGAGLRDDLHSDDAESDLGPLHHGAP